MGILLALPFWALLAGPVPTPPPILTLRDGRTFALKEPPHNEGGRVVFTTTDGKAYSLDPSEVESFVTAAPTPTRGPRTYNPQDSRALGAIARQQRARTGKTTDLSATRPTPRATARPTRTRAPRNRTPSPPARTRTPTPAPR
jgi:hypothetical protein